MRRTIALAGNPNSGKTTLFNRLTGLNHRVGNYPGVTVERRSGRARFADLTVSDLPGTYSLISRSRDEAIAFEVLTGRSGEPAPDLIVIVADASNLDRNLYLALSILELGRPAIVALNMMDAAAEAGLVVDPSALEEALGVPVVPIVARSGEGIEALEAQIVDALGDPAPANGRTFRLSGEDEAAIASVAERTGDAEAVWILSSLGASRKAGHASDDPLASIPPDVRSSAERALPSDDFPARVIEARYRTAREIAGRAVTREHRASASLTDRLDAFLLHPVFGIAFFFAVMGLLFQAIFAWAEPLMDLIEGAMGYAQDSLRAILPAGAIVDLLSDGVVGGVGNVLVFIPQIAFLFFFIAILEDSGYLARAAFISDRAMARIGLHGRAFVPLLSSFACAVPAIMATRTIENKRDRLVTIMVAPLISCSARLPVYSLIIASLFAADVLVLGVFSLGGLLLFAMYLLSIAAAVTAAFVLKRTILESPTPPLVLELPPYRRPDLASVVRRVLERCKVFVRDAGTIILACSIVLWALLYFPRNVDTSDLDAKRAMIAEGPEHRAALAEIDRHIDARRLEGSIAGRIGKTFEPLIAPLGFDWKIGIGLLASFAAREVLVSTLGLVYGVGEADEESPSLRSAIRAEIDPRTGRPVYTPLVGLALMVFFVLACQCMSTLAIVRRETNSWRWPAFMFAYMTVLAWTGALVVYQVGRAAGFE
jgi:ferrous iron transport protein B